MLLIQYPAMGFSNNVALTDGAQSSRRMPAFPDYFRITRFIGLPEQTRADR